MQIWCYSGAQRDNISYIRKSDDTRGNSLTNDSINRLTFIFGSWLRWNFLMALAACIIRRLTCRWLGCCGILKLLKRDDSFLKCALELTTIVIALARRFWGITMLALLLLLLGWKWRDCLLLRGALRAGCLTTEWTASDDVNNRLIFFLVLLIEDWF